MTSESVLEALERHARSQPAHVAIRFLARGEEPTSQLTYAELRRAVDEVALGLVERELDGKPVVLALPPGIEFAIALLGCVRAGVFAVTVPMPASAHTKRVAAIVADARPAAVIVEGESERALPAPLRSAAVPAFTLEGLRSSGTLPPKPAPGDPAVIQYSSGSTREPCGVVVTHANLAANLAMIGRAFRTDPSSVTVSWLPPSHDMGLVGTILAPLFLGTSAVLMPPDAFIKKPIRWLRAIDRYRASISGAPNFAYEICDRRVTPDAARELDLSTWRIAFCGAEPIRPQALHAFADRFAVSGFRRDSFLACYGLAEATLLVSAGPLREIALGNGAGTRVSCGRPAAGCTVAIEGERGEIFIAGEHVSPGRWSGERRAVIAWENAIERDGLRFVATGDVGVLDDGEIVVLERVKDVVAIHGRKVHAIDVENAVVCAGAEVVAAAAFAVDSPRGERLVALCELSAAGFARADRDRSSAILGSAVADATGVAPEIVLLRHGALPRTASGKIVRHAARTAYLAGTLPLPATNVRS